MEEKIRIEVHRTLKDRLESIQKEIAETIKKKYGLQEVTIYGTLASQVLANGYNGKKSINFKINKTGLNSGIIEFI